VLVELSDLTFARRLAARWVANVKSAPPGAVANVPWTASADGLLVDVRLTPRGGRDAIDGVEQRADGRVTLKARVRAAPFEGEANAALCRLLASALHTAPRQVSVVSGATARVKRVRIAGDGFALAAALERLAGIDCKAAS
jgi:uncharacterized protein